VSPSVDIVIVNWNAGRHLRSCLESIARASQDHFVIHRVVVVDNDSRDGSAEGLDDIAVPMEVIRNSRNMGFAAACNQGASNSRSDYLLFLNPDTRLCPDTLETVTGFLETEDASSIGICGVEVVDEDGAPVISCSRFPSLRVFFGKMTGLDLVLPQLFPSHHLRPSDTRRSRTVDQVIGAFYFVRGDLFTKLDGFDERYFVYFEDLDFALRARQAGARTYFLKEARVFHVGNVSSEQVPASRLYYSLRSRLLYARRFWSAREMAALVLLTFTVEFGARIARGVAHRDLAEVTATMTGYGKLLQDLFTR